MVEAVTLCRGCCNPMQVREMKALRAAVTLGLRREGGRVRLLRELQACSASTHGTLGILTVAAAGIYFRVD